MTAEVRTRSATISKALEKAGLVIDPYRRGPIDSGLFTLNLGQNNILRLWAAGKVDFSADRKHRQAVVSVQEKQRKITRRYVVSAYRQNGDMDHHVRTVATRAFPIQIPGGQLSQSDVSLLEEQSDGNDRYYRVVKVEATMVAPAMNQTFLMGFDETRQFIAMLPRKCASVEEAHEALRPDHVKPGTPRQGEFFFVPITQEERAMLEKKLHTSKPMVRPLEGWGERGPSRLASTHQAVSLIRGRTLYVTGMVWDYRPGRHHPLHLVDWHRVVRNRERVVREQARATYWD